MTQTQVTTTQQGLGKRWRELKLRKDTRAILLRCPTLVTDQLYSKLAGTADDNRHSVVLREHEVHMRVKVGLGRATGGRGLIVRVAKDGLVLDISES